MLWNLHYFCISVIHYQQNKAWPRRQASTSSFSDWKMLHCRKGTRETVGAGAQEGLLESIAFSVQQGHCTQKLTATLVKCMCLFKIKTGNCPPLGWWSRKPTLSKWVFSVEDRGRKVSFKSGLSQVAHDPLDRSRPVVLNLWVIIYLWGRWGCQRILLQESIKTNGKHRYLHFYS